MYELYDAALPEVLLPEEEKELIDKLTTHERKIAREALVLRNLRLVFWIAHKYGNELEHEELISVGAVGLIKAVDSFDPSFQRRIAAYATRCIENEILMYLRKEKKTAMKEVCAGFTCPDEKNRDGSLPDPVGNTAVKNALLQDMRFAVSCLKPEEKSFLLMRYGTNSPCSQGAAAEILGISQSCLSRKEKKILMKLRSSMGG